MYILGGQHEGRKLVEGRRGRWDDDILNIYYINRVTVELGRINGIQDMHMCWAVLYKAMNIPVPSLLTGCGTVGFSRSTVLHAVCCLLYL